MYPRRSRFSPEIRPGNARQQLSMTIWACVFLASIVVMFAAFVLSGNFGVRELVCVMIGSGAAVVLGICCFVALPTLVRAMLRCAAGTGRQPPSNRYIHHDCCPQHSSERLWSSWEAGPSQKATKTPVPAPRRRTSQAAKDSVLRPSEGVVAAHTTATISLSILTNGKSRHFEIRTDTKDEFAQPASPYYAVYQACVIQPSATSIVIEVYPRSGIIKTIREA